MTSVLFKVDPPLFRKLVMVNNTIFNDGFQQLFSIWIQYGYLLPVQLCESVLPSAWVITLILNYSLIGKRIKDLRVEKKYTQENIAEHLDISVSYISRIERAAVKISLETLIRVALFLEVSPTYLIEGTIIASGNYLHRELADVICDFNSGQMSLLFDIAQTIKKHRL